MPHGADSPELARWRKQITHFRHTPSLQGVGNLLQPRWLARFIENPHQLQIEIRPRIAESMPRLSLDAQEARDIAVYLGIRERYQPLLAGRAIADWRRDVAPFGPGDPETGERLFSEMECTKCHLFSGLKHEYPFAGQTPTAKPDRSHSRAVARAVDLRITRSRFRPLRLVPWLLSPRHHKSDTQMPQMPLTYGQARDLAAFVMLAPIEPLSKPPLPMRLPILKRPVGYDEVSKRVLRKLCWHCHGNPEYTLDENGEPGTAGGFGFPPRRLDLAEYEGIHGGYLDDEGEPRSVFSKLEDGTSVLVASLLARQLEERGKVGLVRGMPLALPALPPEDIQLVESWVEQGHPR